MCWGVFPKEEAQVMEDAFKEAAEAVCLMITDGPDAAMNHFNAKK